MAIGNFSMIPPEQATHQVKLVVRLIWKTIYTFNSTGLGGGIVRLNRGNAVEAAKTYCVERFLDNVKHGKKGSLFVKHLADFVSKCSKKDHIISDPELSKTLDLTECLLRLEGYDSISDELEKEFTIKFFALDFDDQYTATRELASLIPHCWVHTGKRDESRFNDLKAFKELNGEDFANFFT